MMVLEHNVPFYLVVEMVVENNNNFSESLFVNDYVRHATLCASCHFMCRHIGMCSIQVLVYNSYKSQTLRVNDSKHLG